MSKRFYALISLTSLALLIFYNSSFGLPTHLEKIKANGVLRVLTRIDPTTYYQSPERLNGLEYDLVNLFAQRLGVTVEFIVPATFDDILWQITRNKADIAAAGITVTEQRQKIMRFTQPYQEITEQLLYHASNKKPKQLSELDDGILELVKNTSHIETFTRLKKTAPSLSWLTNDELDSNGLIYLLNAGLIDYTVSDSNQIELIHRFYPHVEIAFDVSELLPIAWALSQGEDDSLYDEVNRFFSDIKHDHTLDQLLDRYYSHTNRLNDFDHCKFREHIRSRLPQYQALFEKAAAQNQLDWRLLAAIGYQESHWQTDVSSGTGVKGVMMVTQDTADLVGIDNRDNAKQSIMGGSQFLKHRIEQIAPEIAEPDRTWFAIAAYNVGAGHLEDARILTLQQKGNPNKWLDVKKRLPLLREEKWFKKTKLGFARGDEPVLYVENIRSYYDLLIWHTEANNPMQKNAMDEKPAIPQNNALAIDSPLL
ncbi:MAG: membrane-bound lytic murein transglycosylase MltF [Methylococcaceae bacterium]|nr:membrane-bound lytic murein transglycosylase MltF [Methylococcaceae bacterium]